MAYCDVIFSIPLGLIDVILDLGGSQHIDRHAELELHHVTTELLAESEGRGVLSVGPPDLNDVIKLLRLGIQSVM